MDPSAYLEPSFLIPVVAVACVLGGVVFAVVRVMLARRAQARVPAWARGAYSIWTGGEDCGAWPRDRAAKSLADWYGATSSEAFWRVVRGLRQGQTGSAAWDKVRALDLLRIGAAAGFVDDEACWKESAAIGKELQVQFVGWEQLAQAFEAGMQAWQRGRGVTDPEQLGRVQRNLPTLRARLWPAVEFTAKLEVED